MIDFGLYIGYALFFAAMFFAIVLPLANAFKSPKALTKTLVAAGVLVLLYLVSFVLSGSEVTDAYIAKGISEGASKRIGSGLIMFYITFIAALLGIVVSEVNKAIK